MKRFALAATVGVLALGLASQTLAQAPSAAPSAPAPSGRTPRPTGSTRGPHDRAELERQRDRVLEELKKHGLDVGSAPLPPLALPSASGSVVAPFPSALPPGQELERRWRNFTASRSERRERHRSELVKELGPRLQDPRVKAEVQLHARRLAELNRLEFLANNARSGGQQAGLLKRLALLREREELRHRAKLAELVAVPVGSASGAPVPAPAPSGSGAAR